MLVTEGSAQARQESLAFIPESTDWQLILSFKRHNEFWLNESTLIDMLGITLVSLIQHQNRWCDVLHHSNMHYRNRSPVVIENMAEKPVSNRDDLSRFVIHLTRDDKNTFSNGASARDNLIAILKTRRILASRPHSIYNKKINSLEKEKRDLFNVACFTEAPLTQLHLLVGQIPGRNIKLAPYGLVFRKEFIISKGGQPAVYINSYDDNSWLREGIDELWEIASASKGNKFWRVFPFINAMHEKHDFSWEREWRIRPSLKFKHEDIVCVILPENEENDLKAKLAKAGIAVISPGWSYETIVSELAAQQRSTKSYFAEVPPTAKTEK